MIGSIWPHIADVLAAASDEQLRVVLDTAEMEVRRRSTMIPRVIKCRRKRAAERVVKQMLLTDGPKAERASTEDVAGNA